LNKSKSCKNYVYNNNFNNIAYIYQKHPSYIDNEILLWYKMKSPLNVNLYNNNNNFFEPSLYFPIISKWINKNKNNSIYNINNINLNNINNNNEFYLIYNSKINGDSSESFHNKCDNLNFPTLTIIQSDNNYIFGGYTKLKWDKSNKWKKDNEPFIFSINLNKCYYIKDNYSIYCGEFQGPTFGNGCDINICDNFMNDFSNKVQLYSYKNNENDNNDDNENNYNNNDNNIYDIMK